MKEPLRTVKLLTAAFVLTLAGFLLFACQNSPGTSKGPENVGSDNTVSNSDGGSESSSNNLVLRRGNSTYLTMYDFVVDGSTMDDFNVSRCEARILRIDDTEGAQAEEIYRISITEEGINSIYIPSLYVEDDILYFVEGLRYLRSGSTEYHIKIKSLDLGSSDSEPVSIGLKMKPGVSIPEELFEILSRGYSDVEGDIETLILEGLLFDSCPKGKYAYSFYTGLGEYEKPFLFVFDITNGEIEFREGQEPVSADVGASLILVTDEYIYYVKTVYSDQSQGVYRADLTTFIEEGEQLFALPSGSFIVGGLNYSGVVKTEDSLYYLLHFWSPHAQAGETALYRFDLDTREETLIVTSMYLTSFQVSGSTVYYFDPMNLHSYDVKSKKNKLLIRGSGYNSILSEPSLTGGWIYFFSEESSEYDRGLKRVKPDASEYPTDFL